MPRMSIIKFVDRLKRMNDLITRKSTGTSIEFAEKLGISRSVLMENLSELKVLGAKIKYCSYRKSYYYTSKFEIIIGDTEIQKKGGYRGEHPLYNSSFFIHA